MKHLLHETKQTIHDPFVLEATTAHSDKELTLFSPPGPQEFRSALLQPIRHRKGIFLRITQNFNGQYLIPRPPPFFSAQQPPPSRNRNLLKTKINFLLRHDRQF